MENYKNMSDKELSSRQDELAEILEWGTSEKWDEVYNEYCKIQIILDERYRERNQDSFDAFYKEHIEGKTREEIDPDDWGFYSDWHKDMYGYRPKHI